jgi:eukaryotic-like serine/threonine-protein kinase
MDQVRDMLASRYELHEVLGRGGMGVVYRAADQVLGRPVAIKMLPVDRADDPAFVARFEREALAAAVVNHPNVVAIYDSGRDDQTRFIVMELVAGRNLSQLLRQQGPVAARDVATIGAQVASALAAAHQAGVIHRDIKPANIMVDSAGHAKVLDFGIARAADSTTLTQTAHIIGSASYLAPELAHGYPADARSDLYALGCVLYELITGHPPFRGETPAAILHQHASTPPRPPSDIGAPVPPALESLVLALLAKDPASRPQPAAELVTVLPAALDDPTAATALLDRASRHTAPTRATTSTRRKRSRLELAGLTLAALLIIGGVVAALLSSGTGHKRAAARHRARPVATSPATPTTLPGAADALRKLVMQDLNSGQIEQQSYQQISNHLTDTITAYRNGNPADALHHANDLATQLAALESQGHIQKSALPALTSAVDNLIAVLERATPRQTTATSPAAPAHPAAPTQPIHPAGKPPNPPHPKPPMRPKGPKPGP